MAAARGVSPKLCFRLFGRLAIFRDDIEMESPDSGKSRELLAYLLLQRGRAVERESLATKLWADSTRAQGRKYLRQALWQIQKIVADHEEFGPIVIIDGDWLRISPEHAENVDVILFDRACSDTIGVAANKLSANQHLLLVEAAPLYRNDLLQGCDEDWCIFERERLQNLYLNVLDKLMGVCELGHHYEEGIQHGMAALRIDLARERTHRILMRMYHGLGDRTGALRQFARCDRALQEELDVRPARRTLMLFEHIRADIDPPTLHKGPINYQQPQSSDERLEEVLLHLKNLWRLLSETRTHLEGEISAVEVTRSRSESS